MKIQSGATLIVAFGLVISMGVGAGAQGHQGDYNVDARRGPSTQPASTQPTTANQEMKKDARMSMMEPCPMCKMMMGDDMKKHHGMSMGKMIEKMEKAPIMGKKMMAADISVVDIPGGVRMTITSDDTATVEMIRMKINHMAVMREHIKALREEMKSMMEKMKAKQEEE